MKWYEISQEMWPMIVWTFPIAIANNLLHWECLGLHIEARLKESKYPYKQDDYIYNYTNHAVPKYSKSMVMHPMF